LLSGTLLQVPIYLFKGWFTGYVLPVIYLISRKNNNNPAGILKNIENLL